jgi:hypothetical protein
MSDSGERGRQTTQARNSKSSYGRNDEDEYQLPGRNRSSYDDENLDDKNLDDEDMDREDNRRSRYDIHRQYNDNQYSDDDLNEVDNNQQDDIRRRVDSYDDGEDDYAEEIAKL